jgi:hypothetical protein
VHPALGSEGEAYPVAGRGLGCPKYAADKGGYSGRVEARLRFIAVLIDSNTHQAASVEVGLFAAITFGVEQQACLCYVLVLVGSVVGGQEVFCRKHKE